MLTAMLAAFIGGIILNFMPCVFPVVSLKALGLLRHSSDTASARREGLAFLLGVARRGNRRGLGISATVAAGDRPIGFGYPRRGAEFTRRF